VLQTLALNTFSSIRRTDRITANTNDNVYFNKAAFSTSALNTFGNAPRRFRACSRRGADNFDLVVAKTVKTGGQTNLNIRSKC